MLLYTKSFPKFENWASEVTAEEEERFKDVIIDHMTDESEREDSTR